MKRKLYHFLTTDKQYKFWHYLLAVTIGAIISFALTVSITSAWVGIGGFASEKRIDRVGVANSSVVISRDGAGTPSVAGLGPRIATDLVTSPTTSDITLNGFLASLNGFPSVTVWFEWGQTTLSNSTAIATATATGYYSATIDITGIDPALPIYYETVGNADGYTRGGVATYQPIATGEQVGTSLISIVLRMAIVACVIIGLVINIHSATNMAMIVVSGGIAYILISYVIPILF